MLSAWQMSSVTNNRGLYLILEIMLFYPIGNSNKFSYKKDKLINGRFQVQNHSTYTGYWACSPTNRAGFAKNSSRQPLAQKE